MKIKRIASLVLCAILCFSSVSVFSATPDSVNPRFTGGGPTSLVIESEEKLPPNGVYVVSVMRDGGWVEAGSIGFNKFLGERQLDLGGLVSGEETVRVRIVQRGGGAAYIDSVFLGGQAPTAVNGSNELFRGSPLYKLRSKDLDLIDAGADGIELEFPPCAGEAVLRVTARIESPAVGGEPFQFPRKNMFTKIDEHSHFYSYRVDSVRGALNIDGQLDEVNGTQPFVKEYCVPSSGHPDGFIYFWVMNDDRSLYVAMDVMPDNTMDGDADYAKVYVKTPGGVKEFKVSVPETQWGTPGFIYTDRAAYQHKVYEFSMPLEQIDIDGVHNADEISLAFSVYGTASTYNFAPSVVYDPENRKFISAYGHSYFDYQTYDMVYQILGCIVDHDGNVIEGDIIISESEDNLSRPSIAYDNNGYRCFVVWINGIYETSYSVLGQMVGSDGGLIGEQITVYEDVYGYNAESHSVAFDASSGTYLVVWNEYNPTLYNNIKIVGQLLDSNGEKIGTPIMISDGNPASAPGNPSVASAGDGQFLVVWHEYNGELPARIYARLVHVDDFAEGGFDPGNIIRMVSTEPVIYSGSHLYPVVAYDNINNKFLVVFGNYDSSDGKYRILGQLVNGNGSIEGMGENLMISGNDASSVMNPTVSFDSYNGKFLVAWQQQDHEFDYYSNIFGRFVTAGGLSGEEFNISGRYLEHSMPSAAYNSNHSNFMVSYLTNYDGSIEISFKKIPPALSPEILGADGLISPGLAKYDLSDPEAGEIRVDLNGNGNTLCEIISGYEYLTSADDDPDNYHYRLDNAPYGLVRGGKLYNKFFSQYRVFLQPSLFSEVQAGDCVEFTFGFREGVSTELHVAVVESSDEDTTGPTVLNFAEVFSLEGGEEIRIEFSEPLHEHSRHAVEKAIRDNIYAIADGIEVEDQSSRAFNYLDIYWDTEDPEKTVVTVANTYWDNDIEYCFYDHILVDIMDFAGNVTTNEPIIVIYWP